MSRQKRMTEREWLTSSDPESMHKYLLRSKRYRPSDRKLRLFACACCRKIWHLLPDERLWKAVESAEQFAEGILSEEGMSQAGKAAFGYYQEASSLTFLYATCSAGSTCAGFKEFAWYVAADASNTAGASSSVWNSAAEEERATQASLLRDIFNNPFRPVFLAPAWMTPVVRNLAQAAYDNRLLPSGLLDNRRLAILGDALEKAGCEDADILSHIREPGPHVRGCWAVDLLTGRE